MQNVKITIVLPAELREALDSYAALHSQLHGEHVDTETLIPYMLEAFIARDRGFKSMRTPAALSSAVQGTRSAPGT